MSEHPILFKGEMVRAILDGRKTQTRRIFIGLVPPNCPGVHSCVVENGIAKFYLNGLLAMHSGEWTPCLHGKIGDRLWVKETFAKLPCSRDQDEPCLDCQNCRDGRVFRADEPERGIVWTPSIHMPRWASRITLEITKIRVERLNDISEADAKAEGVTIKQDAKIASHLIKGQHGPAQLEYWHLWESINGKGSWAINPWVWVIEFEKL